MTEQEIFEAEVNRIARARWPSADESGGPTMAMGQERDGVFETDEAIHLVESTVSRTKDKAIKDIGKLEQLAKKKRTAYPMKSVKGWFVTRDPPTAEQKDIARKTNGLVVAVSFSEFQAKLVDVHRYLNARSEAPFGSMRSPEFDGNTVDVKYTPLDLVERANGTLWSVSKVADALHGGGRLVLLGDYGAGKSTTLREVFRALKAKHLSNKTAKFPVVLNLRDHAGQTLPVEAVERHARSIGFPEPSHLVRAWRAGYVVVILDGFDELGTAGWAGRIKKLKDLRFRSMELVRRFVAESPHEAGIIVAGREHYFDSEAERSAGLGTGPAFKELTLNEFTEEQVGSFLAAYGWKTAIPAWLPTRPLLLGYLVARRLLSQDLKDQGTPARGWDALLTAISQRESAIEVGIDATTVRAIIERLATRARQSVDGIGHLAHHDVINAFVEVCGYEPDDRALVLLQRLPGLGVDDATDGTRRFIDADLVDAARAGDVLRYASDPYGLDILRPTEWNCCLADLGVEVAALGVDERSYSAGLLSNAVKVAAEKEDCGELAIDLLRIMSASAMPYGGPNVRIRDVVIPSLEYNVSTLDFSRVSLHDCYVSSLDIGPDITKASIPQFVGCYISQISGRVTEADLPKGVFDDSVIDDFADAATTTQAILELDLPLRTKVIMTLLKKLYLQKGAGRKESALYRGLDTRARSLVADALSALQSGGLAMKTKSGSETIWLPLRDVQSRVAKILGVRLLWNDGHLTSLRRGLEPRRTRSGGFSSMYLEA